jgi:hypothetical protein
VLFAPKAISEENFQQMRGVEVSHQEELCDCGAFMIDDLTGIGATGGPTVGLGSLELKWARATGADADADADPDTVQTASIALPTLVLAAPPLVVEVKAPPVGHLRQRLPITYSIANHSTAIQDVEFTIHPNEAFMYSGSQHVRLPF